MVRKIGKLFLILILIVLIPALIFFGFLVVTEYRPDDVEQVSVVNNPEKNLKLGKSFTLLTWNIGYGALGENADFFMDGGTHVYTDDETTVNSNIANITSQIKYHSPEIVLIQEVDIDSSRSYHLDQVARILYNIQGKGYTFVDNFKVEYVPFPWPPIGKVESGLLTMSDYHIETATRMQLPIPFSWPIRIASLKRGLGIHEMPIEGTDKKLILINLHLEAYDHGEGKIAQTEILKSIMEEEVAKGNYVIAGGDFNQFFSSVDHSIYPLTEGLWQPGEIDTSHFDGGWQFVMDNKVPSCRSLDKPYAGADRENFQYYIIDGFIISSNIELIKAETKDMGFQFSDHNPVLMKVKLK